MKHTELPKVIEIKKIVQETEFVKTFYFEHILNSRPGQFVNLWLPGVDEKPFSIALDTGDEFAVTFFAVGEVTKKMFELKEGDKLGVRGPYGTNFHFEPNEKLALVAGGYGAAPLYNLANEAAKIDCEIEFIIGARGEEHLLYLDRVEKLPNTTLHISTDDGSKGFKGYNVEILKKLLADGKEIHRIMSCGPELMLKAVSDIGHEHNIDTQISVERFMKCGFGVCGSCCVDDIGITACKDGPVMNNRIVRQLKDFGKYHRDTIGKKHYFS